LEYTAVLLFRERLIRDGKYEKVWSELERQFRRKSYRVRKGVAQDATFITADPGASDSFSPRSTAETRRSKDGSWAKKGRRSYFGYKLHLKADL